jgi:hypothetical protein
MNARRCAAQGMLHHQHHHDADAAADATPAAIAGSGSDPLYVGGTGALRLAAVVQLSEEADGESRFLASAGASHGGVDTRTLAAPPAAVGAAHGEAEAAAYAGSSADSHGVGGVAGAAPPPHGPLANAWD